MPDPISRSVAERVFAADAGLPEALRLAIELAAAYGIVLAALVVLWVGWVSAGGFGLRARLADALWILIPAGIAAVLAVAIAVGLGAALPVDRPFVALGRAPLFPYAADASFPSDHVAAVTALLAGRFRSPGARVLLLLIAVVVGAARVVAGIHWLADVVAGFVLGLACAIVVGRTWEAAIQRPGRDPLLP